LGGYDLQNVGLDSGELPYGSRDLPKVLWSRSERWWLAACMVCFAVGVVRGCTAHFQPTVGFWDGNRGTSLIRMEAEQGCAQPGHVDAHP